MADRNRAGSAGGGNCPKTEPSHGQQNGRKIQGAKHGFLCSGRDGRGQLWGTRGSFIRRWTFSVRTFDVSGSTPAKRPTLNVQHPTSNEAISAPLAPRFPRPPLLASPGRALPPAAMSAEIKAVLKAQADAWNRGDIDGYMDGYARDKDTEFVGGDTLTRGWQTVRDRYRKKYDTREKMGALKFSRNQSHAARSRRRARHRPLEIARKNDQPARPFHAPLPQTPRRLAHRARSQFDCRRRLKRRSPSRVVARYAAQPRQNLLVDAVEAAVAENHHDVIRFAKAARADPQYAPRLFRKTTAAPPPRSPRPPPRDGAAPPSGICSRRATSAMKTPSASASASANCCCKTARRVVFERGSKIAHSRCPG